MFVNLIKFIHLICVLGLLGSVIYCFASIGSKKSNGTQSLFFPQINKIHHIILVLAIVAVITGTLLVYPKSFTFHTHWIQAAYLLLLVFFAGILFIKKKFNKTRMITRKQRLLFRTTYTILFIVLILIIHDAVTKTTFLY